MRCEESEAPAEYWLRNRLLTLKANLMHVSTSPASKHNGKSEYFVHIGTESKPNPDLQQNLQIVLAAFAYIWLNRAEDQPQWILP